MTQVQFCYQTGTLHVGLPNYISINYMQECFPMGRELISYFTGTKGRLEVSNNRDRIKALCNLLFKLRRSSPSQVFCLVTVISDSWYGSFIV